MNKKLPSVYKVNDCTHIKNNKSVFCSSYSNVDFTEGDRNSTDIQEIDFVFNKPVTIKTNNEIIHAKIVSKIDDHILTSNNRVIKIKDIQSIN